MNVTPWSPWVPLLSLLFIQPVAASPDLVSGRQNLPEPAGATGNTKVSDVSRDGRFALLISDAPNLVSPAVNTHLNLYLRDLEQGTTSLITPGLDNGGADGPVLDAFFSDDGGTVVFESRAKNLTSDLVSGLGDLFSYDLATGVTRLISVNRRGNGGGNGRSHGAVLTPDGRFVAFVSQASDLVDNDNNGASDLFRRDLQSKETRLVTASSTDSGSAAASVWPPEDASHSPSMSPDGRYVAFASVAGLHSGTPLTGQPQQIYVRDLDSGTTLLITRAIAGEAAQSGDSTMPVIAGDRVFFLSSAPDLTTELLSARVLYSAPIQSGPITRVSALPGPEARDAGKFQVTDDGQMVAYLFGAGSPWAPNHVRLRNETAGTDAPVTVNTNGVPPADPVRAFQLSLDGSRLAFLSSAPDLTANPVSGAIQLFLADLESGGNELISRSASGESGTADCLNLAANDDLTRISFSALDGNLVPEDINRAVDAFFWGAATDEVVILSAGAETEVSETPTAPSGLELMDVSGDGRYVLFTSMAEDLVENDANGAVDVFLRDREESVIMPISFTPEGQSGNGMSWGPVMTPDARLVAFYSLATNLAGIDTNQTVDVYLRDVAQGATHLVSQALDGQAGGEVDWSVPLVISPDGRWVVFVSTWPFLVQGDRPNGSRDLFTRDMVAGVTYRTPWIGFSPPVDHALGVTPEGRVYFLRGLDRDIYVAEPSLGTVTELISMVVGLPAVSPDGRWIAYATGAAESAQSIWLLDTSVGAPIELISHPQELFTDEEDGRLGISADGQRVTFSTGAALLGTDLNNTEDVYVAELENPGVPILASVNSGGSAATGISKQARISTDGRFVAFSSTAPDLVGADSNASADIFVRDLEMERTWLVSASPLRQGTGQGWSLAPWLSDDGGMVVFTSDAWDLSGRDWNRTFDVFAWQAPVWSEGDHDGDGMDDAWEVRHFGGYHRDGLGDADADGMADAEEFKAGTDPADASSVFALHYQVEGEAGTLRWPGTPDRRYQVEFRRVADEAGWEVLEGEPETAGVGWMRLLDPGFPSMNHRWFRVVLLME